MTMICRKDCKLCSDLGWVYVKEGSTFNFGENGIEFITNPPMPKTYISIRAMPGIPKGETYVADCRGYLYLNSLPNFKPEDFPELFEEVKQPKLYANTSSSELRTPSYPYSPKFLTSIHASQYENLTYKLSIVMKNRLDLLAEKWQPAWSDVVKYASLSNEKFEVSTDLKKYAKQVTVSIWKTEQQAQAECDLLNSLHSLTA